MIEVTGHRGVKGLVPENTLAGFRKAVEIGCHGVELDVRLTSDGQLAVIHDATLDRTTNGKGAVIDCTMAELKTLIAGDGQTIPTLAEVFELLKTSPINIQIELKGPDTGESAAELVREWGFEERVTFTSFFHHRVLRVKNRFPEVTTGILVSCNPVKPLDLLQAAEADNLHVNHRRIDNILVEKMEPAAGKLIAWGNVVETAVIDRLIKLKVDIIGSDRPDLVLERLRVLT